MITGLILLSKDDKYLDGFGNLPARPQWDKDLLTELVRLNTITEAGYNLLPPSIRKVAHIAHMEPQLAITIEELNALPDILMVVRSQNVLPGGKTFRLTNYEPIFIEQRFEMWRRKRAQ